MAVFSTTGCFLQKNSTHWVMTVKQETIRIKRLHQRIADSAQGTNQWKDNKYKKNTGRTP